MEKQQDKQRITILSVPIDILESDAFEERVDELASDGKVNQIVLLGLWDFFRARGNSMFARTVRQAALVLPTSKTVQRTIRLLTKREVPRFLAFDFIIRLLATLEKKGKSVYFIGARPPLLQTAASNVGGSFPDLHIVGRCAGYFDTNSEKDIILAIRKASPSLILAGNGLSGRDQWLFVHREKFAPGITLWAGPCIEIFSGQKKRTSRNLWNRGWDFLPEFFRHPWRIYRLFLYGWVLLVALYYKARKLTT